MNADMLCVRCALCCRISKRWPGMMLGVLVRRGSGGEEGTSYFLERSAHHIFIFWWSLPVGGQRHARQAHRLWHGTVCLCLHACRYIEYVYLFIYLSIYLSIYLYIYFYIYMYIYVYVDISTHPRACMYAHVHTSSTFKLLVSVLPMTPPVPQTVREGVDSHAPDVPPRWAAGSLGGRVA